MGMPPLQKELSLVYDARAHFCAVNITMTGKKIIITQIIGEK
ncbi:hypothetical protein B4168_2808 [Anoxybacillus flavithermus]|nr:hypothetical protein B4168_2808 [Anoxybacillus flavithermus]OAO84864.1 hypothetical protein GT23_3250 [Parageobacillus thermoglucosidasius]